MEYVEEVKLSNEWNFVNSVGKKGIHKLFQYPGTMVPDMLNKIIDTYLEPSDRTVLDPFMGSGTVLFETVKNGKQAIGIDINPYACFGAKVKSRFYSEKTLLEYFNEINNNLQKKKEAIKLHTFPFVEKWYTSNNIQELSRIRNEVIKIKSIKYRNFYLLCLAEVAGKVSNSRKSTFKLHIQAKEDIEKSQFNTVEMFLNVCLSSIKLIINDAKFDYHKNVKVVNENTVTLNKKRSPFLGKEVDAIITSPPYGDNHTTITYGQYSYLRYSWIGIENLETTELLANDMIKISGIDSNSAGGRLYSVNDIENSATINISSILKERYYKLKGESLKNARKVLSFYMDLYQSLNNVMSLLKDDGFL
jgi:DNA modification methylase